MKFIKNLNFMFQFVWKKNKSWLLLIIINTLLGAITPLVNITLPKYIVDSIYIDNIGICSIKTKK